MKKATKKQGHFEGKSVPEHLKEARIRGAQATAEIHGTELSGKKAAFADSVRDTSLTLCLLWLLLSSFLPYEQTVSVLAIFAGGWTIWKTGRSAGFGRARLERLHRIIEEERWEIEHNRAQEREELTELYRSKGFEGELLEKVIQVLMADDNRLLQVMLDEELGIPLEAYEHPLQQASGAFFGSLLPFACLGLIYLFLPLALIPYVFLGLFLATGIVTTTLERARPLPAFVTNLALFLCSAGLVYFLQGIIRL